jgi:CheY-specific phosphatase CheX
VIDQISEDHLTQIAEDICQSLFEGAGTGDLMPPPREEPERTLTAVVDINGDWNGCVSVSCERPTAVLLASIMFDAPGPELSRNDIIDALGEFANMAGGAVKGMLDGDKALGLPTVGEGVDYVMVVPHTTKVADVDYRVSTGDLVHLAVHQLQT